MSDNLTTEQKRALVAELLQRKIAAKQQALPASAMPPIVPVPRTEDMPLSFPQLRQWFLDQLEPGVAAYNLFSLYRLSGTLNIAMLQRSLNDVVQRHEILRTTFVSVDGRPRQVIPPVLHVPLPLISLTHLPPEEREAEVQRLAREEAATPFDLAVGPLIRASLLRLDEKDHYILLTMHHIISDGWSGPIVVREIGMVYAAALMGQPDPLPPLAVQYADYAYWQHQWLAPDAPGGALERLLSYWRQQLADTPAFLSLPTDRPRPSMQTYCGAILPFAFSPQLSTALKQLSKSEGITLFMTLLTALKLVLYRYTEHDDVPVGTYIANRSQSVLEPLLGFFVNNLVLRTSLAGRPTVRELLHRVRDVTLGAYAHQDLPFEKLLEELKVERHLSHTPLFQIMMVLQNTPVPPVSQLPNLTLTRSTLDDNGRANYDLTIWVEGFREEISGHLEYNVDLYDATTIEQFARHFETVLQSMAANPDQRIDEIPLLDSVERRQLLVDWNTTARPYTVDRCIHDLIAEQAARTPAATAVVWRSERLSYAELDRRANQLAHHLQALGIEPEMRVGICLERSLELVVAILAVLKAGAAYTPLDPDLPSERQHAILSDTGAAIVITQQRLVDAMPEHDAQIVCLDGDAPAIAQRPESAPQCRSTADNLAYIIYTSGSTGRPKGVMIPHRNLVNSYRAWEETYDLSTARRHLQMANVTFDVFVGDLVRALCSGGTLVLCPRDLLLAPDHLYDLIRREQIDAAEFVPAVLRPLMQYLAENDLRLDTLRLLVCGSDSWYMEEFDQIRRLCSPSTRVVNSFGVTEATIDSTWYDALAESRAADQLVPIGQPFGNTQIYILDRRGQPVPIGVPGELYLGGAGLARGYLAQPHLTAERFLPHPFSATPGARLYKTGDRARYLADGTIEFLGRTDRQVKLRGFRVELGEIEAVAQQHPSCSTAVVVTRDMPGGTQLVAYAEPISGAELAVQDLRLFLKKRLPDYMVPGHIVLLETLPRTASGKIDRRALPAPDMDRAASERAYTAPSSLAEEVIADIFQQISGITRIGVHDNFFEFGLHSLLAIQFASRIRSAFEVDIPIRAFFEAPTVADLALVAEEALLEKIEAMDEDAIEID
ncbi:MAG TPA: amino acid adenylation domain-containing protein [Herpetosiphonaceae bacterium]